MASPYMVRRRQGWYLRLRVPSDLAPILGHHFVRSLGSSIRIDAQKRALAAANAAPAAWSELRTMAATWMGTRLDEVTKDDALAAAADKHRALADYAALTPDERSQLKDRLADITLRSQDQLDYMRGSIDQQAAAFEMAESARQRGILEGMQKAMASFAAMPAASVPAHVIAAQTTEDDLHEDSKLIWSELVPKYFKHNSSLTEKTQKSYLSVFREWTKAAEIAHVAIKDITPKHVVFYADEMSERISNRGRPLHHDTIQKNLSHIKAFLNWAVAKNYVPDRPFAKVTGRAETKAERASDGRRAFTTAELQKLFDSPLFTGYKSDFYRSQPGDNRERGADFWFLATAALTGARTEEISTAPAELFDCEGVPCLDLREVGKKTEAGSRLVPIIPELRKLGFLDWCSKQSARGHGLVYNPFDPRTSDAWSKRLNRYIDDTVLEDPLLVLYSLRHAHRQMLRASRLNLEIINKVFGHEGGTVGEGYGADLSGQEARQVVQSLKPPIHLDHLYVRSR